MYSVLGCVLVILAISAGTKAQQSCVLASNGERPLPNFIRAESGEPRFEEIPIQAIITSYKFNCCGAVTEWRAFAESSNGVPSFNENSFISFQVWRPNSPSTDGCYTLIGFNNFSPISLGNPGTAERETVIGVPSEANRIEVQPGDVVGFSLDHADPDVGIQFAGDEDNDPEYTNEAVWYTAGSVVIIGGPCPVGPGRILSMSTDRAPLIRATVSMSPCKASTTGSSQPTASTTPHQSLILSLQPTPTPMDTTTPGPDGRAGNTGLYVVIAVLAFILVLGGTLVCLCCVITRKRGKRRPTSSDLNAESAVSRDAEYETVTEIPQMILQNNSEAYGKFSEATSTEPIYDDINPPAIPTTQNQAYGDTADPETDYYVNEGLGGPAEMRMDGNEAYGVSSGPNSETEPSIPTTENEAYTAVLRI